MMAESVIRLSHQIFLCIQNVDVLLEFVVLVDQHVGIAYK
jgi:hypothetical protein